MNKLETVNIKGKEYVMVNERLKYFRHGSDNFRGWSLVTEIVELTADRVVMVAKALDMEGKVRATGTAYEESNSSFINKTSFIENCETSAWGRCLANLGIGIDSSIASSLEVQNAVYNQNKGNGSPIAKTTV